MAPYSAVGVVDSFPLLTCFQSSPSCSCDLQRLTERWKEKRWVLLGMKLQPVPSTPVLITHTGERLCVCQVEAEAAEEAGVIFSSV